MYKVVDPPYEPIRNRIYESRLAAAIDFTSHFDREQHQKANSLPRKALARLILPITRPLAIIEYRFTLKFEKVRSK